MQHSPTFDRSSVQAALQSSCHNHSQHQLISHLASTVISMTTSGRTSLSMLRDTMNKENRSNSITHINKPHARIQELETQITRLNKQLITKDQEYEIRMSQWMKEKESMMSHHINNIMITQQTNDRERIQEMENKYEEERTSWEKRVQDEIMRGEKRVVEQEQIITSLKQQIMTLQQQVYTMDHDTQLLITKHTSDVMETRQAYENMVQQLEEYRQQQKQREENSTSSSTQLQQQYNQLIEQMTRLQTENEILKQTIEQSTSCISTKETHNIEIQTDLQEPTPTIPTTPSKHAQDVNIHKSMEGSDDEISFKQDDEQEECIPSTSIQTSSNEIQCTSSTSIIPSYEHDTISSAQKRTPMKLRVSRTPTRATPPITRSQTKTRVIITPAPMKTPIKSTPSHVVVTPSQSIVSTSLQSTLLSPFTMKSPTSIQNENAIVTIQSVFRGRLERKSLEMEKLLSSIPLISPSTPSHHPTGVTPVAKRQRLHSSNKSIPTIARIDETESHDEITQQLDMTDETTVDDEEIDNMKSEPGASDVKRWIGELKKHRKVIKDIQTTWTLRVTAMNAIECLVRHENICSIPTWSFELESLRPCLIIQLNDLRSSIVRETCRLLIALAETCPREMAELLTSLLPVLCERLYVTIKVISCSADECIRAIILRVNSVKCVQPLLTLCNDPHAIVREKCALYLNQYLNQCNINETMNEDDSRLQPHIQPILSMIKKNIMDGDKDVRLACRTLFQTCSIYWKEATQILFDEFSGAIQRTIESERRSQQTNKPNHKRKK